MTDATEGEAKKGLQLDDIPWYTVPAVLLGVPALMAILSLIWPQVFLDKFLEPFYFAPIRGDTGYNGVNTATWAVLLGFSLLGLTQMVNGLKIKVDAMFIYGAVAWVVTGSIFRVVEDMDTFRPPLQYIMITPPIYLLFGAFGVLSLLIGIYIHKCSVAKDREYALQKLWMIDAIFILLYLLVWVVKSDVVRVYLNPLTVALLVAFSHFVIRYRITKVGEVRPKEMMLMLTIAPFLMGMAYIVMFSVDPWKTPGAGIPSSFLTVPLLALGLTGTAVAAISAANPEREENHRLTLIFAAIFTAILGIVLWTAPAATRTPFNVASIASIVGIGVVLGGLSVLMTRLLRRRAEIVHILVLAILAIVGYAVFYAIANFVLGDVLNQTPATWSLHGIAAIGVAYFAYTNRVAIGNANAYLKRTKGIGSHITGAFLIPLNIFLIVSQTMDGFATSLGLDLGGYSEKHVLSASLINSFHDLSAFIGWEFGTLYPTFLAFVPVKLAISLAVVYAIDVYSREDVKQYPALIGFVKFAIIMVGIGPAVRDFARLSLGI
jgi:uncharacterized membrane protein